MNSGRVIIMTGIGCLAVIAVALVAVVWFFVPLSSTFWTRSTEQPTERQSEVVARPTLDQQAVADQRAVPTFTPVAATAVNTSVVATTTTGATAELDTTSNLLANRYERLTPGVVNINVIVGGDQGGQGAGSGFILDTEGHIVTNHHVIDQAAFVSVVFFNGVEVQAEIIGSDDDSDLAVLQVTTLPDGTYPLPLADSDLVHVGDWAIAIGNPFGLGGSMTLGIISALGRVIPSGVAGFSIPQAIQTDAAINPGNSGGPLLNLAGQVIGVNAQIRTSGSNSNSGVGFAIPANVVRRVIPVLIANGAYQWPWAGIQGDSINLLLSEANDLPNQEGAYLDAILPNGPADDAGLQGSTGNTTVDGFQVPVGGDVVIAVDGEATRSFDELLNRIAFKTPGDEVVFTVLRDGQQVEQTIVLEARPDLTQAQ
jgi:S1-C subfamily serine protease